VLTLTFIKFILINAVIDRLHKSVKKNNNKIKLKFQK
jgi:hypothetical protein